MQDCMPEVDALEMIRSLVCLHPDVHTAVSPADNFLESGQLEVTRLSLM